MTRIIWENQSYKPYPEWGIKNGGPTITYEHAVGIITGLLTQEDFLRKTMYPTIDSRTDISDREVGVSYVNEGTKNGVFKVRVGLHDNKYQFGLIISKGRGREKLNEETELDYRNLNMVRRGLEERKLPVFVPRPYVLSCEDGVNCFSVQWIDGYEMNVGRVYVDGRGYVKSLYFKLNSLEPLAMRFNEQMLSSVLDARSATSQMSSKLIKALMVRNLHLLYNVAGGVPAEFRINAGDFMLNLHNLELYLITIRGGLKPLDTQFEEWLRRHLELDMDKFPDELKFFKVFDDDSIKDGLEASRVVLENAQ